MDITSTFLTRFDGLARDMSLVSKGEMKELDFGRRYWFFQQEQFVLWRNGLVDNDLFKIWMDYRKGEWQENQTLQKRTYRQVYEAVASSLLPEFREFLNCAVFSGQRPFNEFKRPRRPSLRRRWARPNSVTETIREENGGD